MMRSARLVAIVAVAMVSSAQARAQPLFSHAESIEATVANADLVIVGRLVEFGEGVEGKIDVEETLKRDIFAGEPHRRLGIRFPYSASMLAGWKDRSLRLLVAVNEDNPGATKVIPLGPAQLEVLTADFRLLRDPEAVIRVAKETVRRVPAPVRRFHTFARMVPREAVTGTEWEHYYGTGGCLFLGVPVDGQLETHARDDIRSSGYQRREEGVRALRYFRSEENIARLKGLLNDQGWARDYSVRDDEGIEVHFYGVRQEAYSTLSYWGVEAEQPLIREAVRK